MEKPHRLEPKSFTKSIEIADQKDQKNNSIQTEGVTPLHDVGSGYIEYNQRLFKKDALRELRPDLFNLQPDKVTGQNSKSFGTQFPKIAAKGDMFVRVDILPNKVFKFDGKKWIEVSKEQTNTYLYETEYIKYLVDKIGSGEYDIDLLSETEKEQIHQYLQNNQNT